MMDRGEMVVYLSRSEDQFAPDPVRASVQTNGPEMLETVGPLTDPIAHGGTPEDAFHLVLPSLPGYGFSGEPAELGWESGRIARAWAELMNLWVPRTASPSLTSAFAAGRPQHHRPLRGQRDPSIWPSNLLT